ncbi:hypothetical protein [Desulfofundulus sp. TPOSR]|uniref:hypothetical protein n=1 Tax=Desulfofundulus sp. TPOSR TaxID=2714340 RepID=UPI001FAD2787|nr:hypothetical protein [Desulfofundulus sp. TPOSR]
MVIATTDAGPKRGGDSFWDRAEQNLLKALALYVVLELPEEERHMGSLYDILASGDPEKVDAMFAKLPVNHPAKGPYNVYAMAGQNVRGGVVIGLGTRLQVFQQELVRQGDRRIGYRPGPARQGKMRLLSHHPGYTRGL